MKVKFKSDEDIKKKDIVKVKAVRFEDGIMIGE